MQQSGADTSGGLHLVEDPQQAIHRALPRLSLRAQQLVAGHSLNIYTTFTKVSGSVSAATLGATLMRPFVGDSGQFIPRTIGQIVEGLQKTGAAVTLVEAYRLAIPGVLS